MNQEFIGAINELEKERGIQPEILFDAIEVALITAFKKNFDSNENVRVSMDRETGDIHVYAQRKVVEEVMDPDLEISLEDAKEISKKYELDDLVEREVTPRNFGRIAAQTAKQVVIQRIREAERDATFNQYLGKEGDIVNGIVTTLDKRGLVVELGKTEALLLTQEIIPGEKFRVGERVKAYITKVEKSLKGPQVFISRTHPGLVKRLFELEVPEIYEGIIEIVSVAREAGLRTKMAVMTKLENIDPVGSCVGQKGTRVQNIINELKGEKIDIIEWSPDTAQYIASALNPAEVLAVDVNEEEKTAKVVVPDNQLSLAIGKEGQNARLAARLTGFKIDIKSETQIKNEILEI
ncbi:MAG: transcription termination/antitermination protein NusA [Clostridia bacterium]|nr:transcription termination/antitermination protein NusA [Clostridia bacterium]